MTTFEFPLGPLETEKQTFPRRPHRRRGFILLKLLYQHP
jgi:hypothetical protein